MGKAQTVLRVSNEEFQKMAKEKTCKGCEEDFPLKDFPNSATAKDGKLGYCSECWSKRMKAARSKRGNGSTAASVGRPPKNGHKNDNVIDMANRALSVSGKVNEVITVIANDGEERTFRGKRAKKQALKQAMTWMLDGYKCVLRTETTISKKEKVEFSLKTVSRG